MILKKELFSSLLCYSFLVLFGTCTLVVAAGLLFALSLIVSLLKLTLLNAFGNGCAACIEDDLDALRSIIVGGDGEIAAVGVSIGVHDSKNGDSETVSFLHGNVLLANVDYEKRCGQTLEVGDGTEVLLKLGTLAADLQDFALGKIGERSVSGEFVDVGHLLHSLADGLEVGEHATGPALGHIGHIYGCCLFGNDFLGLLLSSYKKNQTASLGDGLEGFSSLVNLGYGLVEVDDVDSVTLHENIGSHCRIPFTLEVAEVASSLKKGFEVCSRHFESDVFLFVYFLL